MANKKRSILIILVPLLLVSACSSEVTHSIPTHPVNLLETSEPKEELFEDFQVTGDTSSMYPSENAQIATVYPAWDRPKVKIEDLKPPVDAHKPSDGKASISGLLYAFDISVPLADIEFIFVPAVIVEGTPIVPPIITNGDPANGDIIGKTDANGAFYLDNIPPGLYYLLINYPDHSVIAVESENTSHNRLFKFEANKSYPLGVIKILS